jgi:3-oxoacyl-[acyl-carrier protein] reductase
MKTVIVTGASRGVGLALTIRLLAEGCRVVAVNRTQSDDLAQLAERHPGQLLFEPLDMGDADNVMETGRRLAKAAGPIWGLVNNAAIGSDSLFAMARRSDIARIIETNLTGPILLTRQIVPGMIARRTGSIVMVTSVNARTGYSGQSVYGATKAGLEGFARSLSREVGKRGVTVNCVAPGFMKTALTANLTGDRLASVVRRSPLGPATPDEVAAAIQWLLSSEARRVTGTVMTVDGGGSA